MKALKGTLRKDREPQAAPAAIAGSMVAPVPLTPRALEHFDAIVGLLSAEGRSSQHFAYTVALLAQRLDQSEQLQTMIAVEGTTYFTLSKGGVMYRARPEVAMLGDALRHTQALLSELMLSPTAAQRLGKREAPVSNPFDEI